VVLQSKAGNYLTARFPQIARAVATLDPGTVLDGEICAVIDGLFRFDQLQLAHRDPAAHLVFVCFDVLAVPGRDMRPSPLSERWRALGEIADNGPGVIQRVMATVDRDEAVTWYDTLADVGVEGLVGKGMATAYKPGVRWLKVRHADTQDGRLIGVTASARRPRTVLALMADENVLETSPALDPVQSRQVADAIKDLDGDDVIDQGFGRVHLVLNGPTVELRVGTGRHGRARFVRIRESG